MSTSSVGFLRAFCGLDPFVECDDAIATEVASIVSTAIGRCLDVDVDFIDEDGSLPSLMNCLERPKTEAARGDGKAIASDVTKYTGDLLTFNPRLHGSIFFRVLSCGELFAGRYEIVAEIGSGGQGVVYSAFDRETRTNVAIKVPRCVLDGDEYSAFVRNAYVAKNLNHHGVCRILEVGNDVTQPFIAMDLIDGQPAERYLERFGGDRAVEVCKLIASIAEILRYTHSCGVVHLDLKPSNILIVGDGLPVILDFGSTGNFVGKKGVIDSRQFEFCTPLYAAPEVLRQCQATAICDIFSLGVMMFEWLAGKRPFTVESFERFQVDGIVPQFSGLGVSTTMVQLCRDMLCLEPETRISADEVFCRASHIVEVLSKKKVVERRFGVTQDFEISGLTSIQTASYARFLQADRSSRDRLDIGLQSVLREVFPIVSVNGEVSLEYDHYELGKPRYTPEECRQLRLTYGMPFRVWLRLVKEQPVEEEVYLGDIPIMIGGGEFIINGAERVVVSQLHRSPGVDFVMAEESASSDRKTHSCRIIPERGSWIELLVCKRDVIGVRIDQSGKFSALTLLRAMSRDYSTDAAIIRLFYPTQTVKISAKTTVSELEGKYSVEDVVFPAKHERAGEIVVDAGSEISEAIAEVMIACGLKSVEIISEVRDPLILKTLAEDGTSTHEEALLKIYQRLRPGNPPNLDKASDLFRERFFDLNRYRMGRVGRLRINRRFQQDISDDEMTLNPVDYINAMKYIVRLRIGDETAQIDDIDNLGNRRLRTIDELAADEIRKGFLKLRRTVQERMSVKEVDAMTPRTLINPKSVSAAIDYFYGRSELSQVVDQTNPLSMLTHERRLSALGPGGLNRKRAGFEVRDVHISHYGRICPIEAPEGTNIGLISSLSIYSRVDDYGFLISPYRVIRNAKVTDEVVWLRADEEASAFVCPADTLVENGQLAEERVLARNKSDVVWIDRSEVQYIDVAPCQMVGVSAGLIPFLEHDDANLALMGSNMQRQAVPLLVSERPVVGTGMEPFVAQNSGMVLRAEKSGKVTYVDANVIEIDGRRYPLRKFMRLNERTCLNQKPIVRVGDKVKAGQVLCDSAATKDGSLALGRNVLVAFMSWEGYNFEDAIILSERLVKEDVYTSIHLDEFDVEIRETKLGREEFTRDIPNVSEKALRHLDDSGIVKVGTRVNPGDILVGKVSPKAKSELTPEEKLLHAIFGRAGEDVKNESLEVPSGVGGIVIHTEKFSRRISLSEVERKRFEDDLKKVAKDGETAIAAAFKTFLVELEAALEQPVTDEDGRSLTKVDDPKVVAEFARRFHIHFEEMDIRSPQKKTAARKVVRESWVHVEDVIDREDHRLNSMKRGDELPSGVLQMVKVYVASKRQISVGDKMAGRHGNKGVISKVLPIEDMPFLADGTPVDIILNPLGVPSRMNVGQILEARLGWAAGKLGYRAVCPVFDGASEEDVRVALREAGLPEDGKTHLHDGRTGERLEQEATVGYIYMMKLHHLVDDKVHARATGPYSLITQQPLGGKARFGGQRIGNMEVGTPTAYGAADILQELLTVKSDDVEGRTKIYESMVKGENTLEAGTPASFEVLNNAITQLIGLPQNNSLTGTIQ